MQQSSQWFYNIDCLALLTSYLTRPQWARLGLANKALAKSTNSNQLWIFHLTITYGRQWRDLVPANLTPLLEQIEAADSALPVALPYSEKYLITLGKYCRMESYSTVKSLCPAELLYAALMLRGSTFRAVYVTLSLKLANVLTPLT